MGWPSRNTMGAATAALSIPLLSVASAIARATGCSPPSDGSEVLFESAESDLVALHGGQPEVRDGGKLTARLQEVAEAAEEVVGSLRARLVLDEVSLEFGLKVSGGVNWFFAKAQG